MELITENSQIQLNPNTNDQGSNVTAATDEHIAENVVEKQKPSRFAFFKQDPEPIPVKNALLSIVKSSWLNILVVFIPLGMVSHFVWTPTVTFILNFIAIIPLAKLLGFATEDIALRTGETLGGLLNATFGNAVELIISIISLTKNLVVVVQASMLGSILSNLLLVLGMCFAVGGYVEKEPTFNVTSAQTSASLLFIATASLLLPAAFYGSTYKDTTTTDVTDIILKISRATAIIMLVIYFAYLFFQLKTHKHLLTDPKDPVKVTRSFSRRDLTDLEAYADDEEEEKPQLPWWLAAVLLCVVTALVGVCSEFLVDAIDDVVQQWHISETFVGLILLPIVGNAAEHVTAVTVAYKKKMELALGVAVGSSTQIALLVTPLTVIIGWGMGVEMSLYFNIYETAVMFIAVILVNYLISDGKTNWLEGFMLFAIYIIIAISFYYYPDSAASAITPSNSTAIAA